MMKKQDLISPALMREQIVSLLPEAGKCFGDEDNLIEWGLDSLHVMRLVSLWRRAGAKVSFATLIEQPTLAAWQKLLMHCVHQDVAAPEKMDFKTTGSDGPAAVFGLTDVQHAYWIGRRDDQPLGGVGCHAYLEFDGEGIDPVRLEKAWQQVIHGHKMLRARFNDEGLQWIGADTPSARLTVHDLRTLDPVECNTELVAIRQRLSHRRLAVAQGETSGLTLSLLPGGATRIHFDIDLLVADVLSLQIVMHDLAAAYADGYGPDVPSAWHFSTYLAQEAQRKAPQMAQHRAYWTDRLSRLPGGPQLPLYTAPETIGSPEFTRRQYHLSGRQWQQLKVHAAGHRVTPAMTLISVYAEILAYWSSDKHFSLNVPLFDRQAVYPDIDKVVADFTNLLLLEVDCREKMTFEARVQAVQKQFHEDIAHADYSAVQVLRDLARQHQGERIAVPVVFACNLGAPFIDETTHSVLGKMNYMISQTPQVWLDHQVYELEEGLLLTWDSVDALFPPALLDTMFSTYISQIEALASDPTCWQHPLNLTLPPAQQAVRAEANQTAHPFTPHCLHDGFFTQAQRHPEQPALIFNDQTVSYGTLRHQALQTAAWLQTQGLQPGQPVAITLPRGIDQIAAVLGILAAGGCYVPISPTQPEARRKRILSRAAIQHEITAAHLPAIQNSPPLTAPVTTSPQATAYLLFTSGSTGEPKGVEITHQSASNTIDDINHRYNITAQDRLLAVSSLDFDLSVYDIFGLLQAGGTLILLDESRRRDAAHWRDLIHQHQITLWNSVPVLLDMLLIVSEQDTPSLPLRLALLSGDWIGLDLPGRLMVATAGACRIIALGGATEASIWSNAQEINLPLPAHWRSIPYGTPLANQQYRVVDPHGRDCPDWVAGELWIGGTGVARGYLGMPEQNAASFITARTTRWYRTGDQGRYWPDGTLEFLGRIDHQVKIRGHRIELGEIETALKADPRVAHAVAVTLGHPAILGVAVLLAEDKEISAVALQQQLEPGLSERVPEYMIPSQWLSLTSLPLNINGKIDRTAIRYLLEQQAPATKREAEPVGEIEQRVAAVWQQVLGLEGIGREDDFFLLGGDSLLATRVIAQLKQKGIFADQPLSLLFSQPVLCHFAAGLTIEQQEIQPVVAPVISDEKNRFLPFPLTDVQRAYWIGRTQGLPLSCATTYLIELDGQGIDLSRFELVWNRLVERHEMLRAVMTESGQQCIIAKMTPYRLVVEDCTMESAKQLHKRLLEHWGRWRQRQKNALPFEIHALRYGSNRCRIGLFFDYLFIDGFSINILLNELAMLYTQPGHDLPALDLSFRDYALTVKPDKRTLEKATSYWHEKLKTLPLAPALPLAVSPEEIGEAHFVRRSRRLSSSSWMRIKHHARQYGVTPSAVLLTLYGAVLSYWGGGAHTLNLTLFDRREVHPDIHAILGDFTTLAAVAYYPAEAASLLEQIRRVQQELVEVLEHQAFSSLSVQRERFAALGAAAALPVVFTSMLGLADDLFKSVPEGFPEIIEGGLSETPQVWLDHQVYEYRGELVLQWDSVDALFPPALLDTMFSTYISQIEALASDPTCWQHPLNLTLPPAQQAVRAEANQTAHPFTPHCLHDGFFTQAQRHPEQPALIFNDQTVSYGTLRHQALQTAAWLQTQGLQPGQPVAITLPRGIDQIAAVLGILAAGGCYVPISPTQPEARRKRILSRAAIQHEITAAHLPAIQNSPPLTAPVATPPQATAYLLFTSGSTGEPKGVEITHQSASNTIDDINHRYNITAQDRLLAVSSLDFDLSVYDIFGLLQAGGTLILLDESRRRDAAHWRDLIHQHQITLWNSVPVLLDMLLIVSEQDTPPLPLRLALLSGDWIGLDLPGRLMVATAGACRIIALGGATEASIWSNAQEINLPLPAHWRSVPYGTPLANQQYRVVDPHGRDCPDWVAGELWIGGTGVARGYLGMPEQNAASFITARTTRWYRTGDQGRYWPDGTLEFLGRIDHQVKIRGHRIELGEIETALKADPRVAHAVAVTLGHPAILGVAVLLAEDKEISAVALQQQLEPGLSERVPEYMIPSQWLSLTSLPLNINGKIDRTAIRYLLEQQAPATKREAEPVGEIEQRVAAVWQQVLGLEGIGREDDFFLLGGDSLCATQIVEQLYRQGLTTEIIPLRYLFTAPALAEFSRQISSYWIPQRVIEAVVDVVDYEEGLV